VHIDFRHFLKQHIREVTADSCLKRLQRLSRITNLDDTDSSPLPLMQPTTCFPVCGAVFTTQELPWMLAVKLDVGG